MRVLLIVFLLLSSVAVQAKNEEVDYLSLAALMIRDGDYLRAADALDEVDVTKKGIDLKRYYTLSGLIGLHTQNYERAVDGFQAAIKVGQKEAIVQVYLAQAYYGLKDYRHALSTIEQAGEAAAKLPPIWMLKAQSHWYLGEKDASWNVLQQASARFDDNLLFKRRSIFLLIEQGLYQEAAERGLAYVQDDNVEYYDYLAIGKALIKSHQADKALPILEQARMRFGDNEKAALALAHAYVAVQQYSAAAELLEDAAAQHNSLASDAAELHRKAGNKFRALYVNSQVLEQKKKFRQRMALLLETEQYELAAQMEDDLYLVGLTSDQNIRYALAFANYRIGNFEVAEKHLSLLTRADLFRKAAELRSAMNACGKSSWQCI